MLPVLRAVDKRAKVGDDGVADALAALGIPDPAIRTILAAAAIEAVASNGGQVAPPIMGATAFIIAEFLEVPYQDVVVAAIVPAALYFLVLFLQVDAIAARNGLMGLPKEGLPEPLKVFLRGWVFLIPIAVMLYFLFGLGFNPGLSAMYAVGTLALLMVVKEWRLPSKTQWSEFF